MNEIYSPSLLLDSNKLIANNLRLLKIAKKNEVKLQSTEKICNQQKKYDARPLIHA